MLGKNKTTTNQKFDSILKRHFANVADYYGVFLSNQESLDNVLFVTLRILTFKYDAELKRVSL